MIFWCKYGCAKRLHHADIFHNDHPLITSYELPDQEKGVGEVPKGRGWPKTHAASGERKKLHSNHSKHRKDHNKQQQDVD
jgi:hypothetical protein